jgi:hypothetical protein
MIDRRTIFTEAWKSAKRTAGQYRTIRCAFAAALRRVWSLVKAMMVEAKRPTVSRPVARPWESENTYRAAAVTAHKARLGSYVIHCW